jgi:hypothetical protein
MNNTAEVRKISNGYIVTMNIVTTPPASGMNETYCADLQAVFALLSQTFAQQ